MAVDKSLTQAPMGIEALAAEEEPIEVVITDDDGQLLTEEETSALGEQFDDNLAEFMDDGELGALSSELVAAFEEDLIARKDWLDTYMKGIDLLGLKYEERTQPWAGACGITHPVLMESAVRFQSDTMMETFPAAGPVKTKIIGKETTEKRDAAARVTEDMNYQLTEVMKEYRPEHERLLLTLCLSGNAFKKVYFDPGLDRQTAVFVTAEDIVVPYGASSIDQAERVTHVMRKTKNEVRKLQVAGFYRDIDMGEPMSVMDNLERTKAKEQGYTGVVDRRFQILEMHVNRNLPGFEDPDGIELPYVITIDRGTGYVLSIRRNWEEDDEVKKKRQHFVHYGYVPGFGFYYFGLIHLIGGHTKTATSLTRQLVDSGTLANLPGGFKTRGLRIKGDGSPHEPGEWKDVDVPGGTLKENLLPLPYKEPSATLLTMLDKVVDDARRFASTADLKMSDMSAQAPVGTTLAVLERMLKVMSAVQSRIHFAMKQEFKLLKAMIAATAPEEYSYEPEIGSRMAKQSDYEAVDVIPVSDPNATTMAQRVVTYQAVMELAKTAPQIYDQQYLHRQMVEQLGVKNAAKIIPTTDDMKPLDPVTENMNVLMGKPVKAFMYQDHDAHLQVHMNAMQDPMLAQVMGQNPQAPQIQAAAMAHIMEHVAWKYRRDIEVQLGATLPPPPKTAGEEDDTPLPADLEVKVSQLAALASQKLLQMNIMQSKAMEAQMQANDPLMQLQARDVAVKEAEVERKKQKDMLDAAAKADTHALREKEVAGRQQLDALRIVSQTAKDTDQLENEAQRVAADADRAGKEMEFRKREGDQRTALDAVKHASDREDRQNEFHANRVDKVADRRHQLEQAKLQDKAKPKTKKPKATK